MLNYNMMSYSEFRTKHPIVDGGDKDKMEAYEALLVSYLAVAAFALPALTYVIGGAIVVKGASKVSDYVDESIDKGRLGTEIYADRTEKIKVLKEKIQLLRNENQSVLNGQRPENMNEIINDAIDNINNGGSVKEILKQEFQDIYDLAVKKCGLMNKHSCLYLGM